MTEFEANPIDPDTLTPGTVIKFVDGGDGPTDKTLHGNPDDVVLHEGHVEKVITLDDGSWWALAWVDANNGSMAIASANIIEATPRI